MKYLIIFYVVPAAIAVYYEVKEWFWLHKRHMSSSTGIKRSMFRILCPVFNLLYAILLVSYDMRIRFNRRRD